MNFQPRGVGRIKAPNVHGVHMVTEEEEHIFLSDVKGSSWRTEKAKQLNR